MFCLLKPLSIIYHMLVFLSAPSDVHRRVSHAANVGMWSHGYWALKKQKTHNLHRHLETTCSTCSNVDGKDRNDLRTRRTFQVPGTWFPPIFGAWNYHLYQLWPKKTYGTGLLCTAASPTFSSSHVYIVHGTIFGQKEMMSRSSNIGGELAPIFIESDCIWYIEAMRRLLSYEACDQGVTNSKGFWSGLQLVRRTRLLLSSGSLTVAASYFVWSSALYSNTCR